jgi:hypothetical protein
MVIYIYGYGYSYTYAYIHIHDEVCRSYHDEVFAEDDFEGLEVELEVLDGQGRRGHASQPVHRVAKSGVGLRTNAGTHHFLGKTFRIWVWPIPGSRSATHRFVILNLLKSSRSSI